MKRALRVLGIGLLLMAVAFPVQPASAQSVNVNNFRITRYSIHYELGRDAENRSTLRTTETIVAQFPLFDQNHGIERAIPTTYEGHPVSLVIDEVTDGQGQPIGYTQYSDGNGNNIMRIGDADKYVRGVHTYNIVYSQRDVTRFYKDTGRDEWYWDTNGTEWRVPIDMLNISITVHPGVATAQTVEPYCYKGAARASTVCALTKDSNGSYSLTENNLPAGNNVTVAFGFQPDTFAEYIMSPAERVAYVQGIVQTASPVVTGVLVTGFYALWMRRRYRMSEQGPTPAQFTPPKDASVAVSSQVVAKTKAVFTAQLIDLAVRRYISIIETKPKSLWSAARYDIVIANELSSVRAEEAEILNDMFGHEPSVGERMALLTLKNNPLYQLRISDNEGKVEKLMDGMYAIRQKSPEKSKIFYVWAIIAFVFSVVTFAFLIAIAAVVLAVLGFVLRPLTDKGLQLRRYVLGLDKYIKASEAERLAFLQGPDTAQKLGYKLDPSNPGELVKLYERLLPYAILFGCEKEWSKRLGRFYEQTTTQPTWYQGTNAFNAAVFASGVQSFAQSSAYSSGVSSGSGGSSGGGFSGGGGGGGGGGGW